MAESDESTVKVLLKGSMQWIREERNKYREMYDRTRHDLKEEKKKRKAVYNYINTAECMCLCVNLGYLMPNNVMLERDNVLLPVARILIMQE